MRKNFDIKKIFATQAVIVSRKDESRREFYFNGLLPLEQAALDTSSTVKTKTKVPT